MVKVTVIIPSYNHEKFVAEAIQSVLNQTYQDFEIVITDDGSTDGTVDVIKSFADPRIKLFCFETNQGACVTANKCISEAKGKFIAMLSSDDVFAPNKLEKQVAFLEQHLEVGAVFSYAEIIDEYGNNFTDENYFHNYIFRQANRTRFQWLNHFFFHSNCLCHPSVLIRKECYEKVGLYDERLAQLPDYDFWIRLCFSYEIYIMPENLISFRILKNQANASGKRPETIIRQEFEWNQILNNYLNPNIYKDFFKVFPLEGEILNIFKQEHIPFIVGMLALNNPSQKHRSFALNTIYKLLENKKVAQEISEIYSFNWKEFIKLTGSHDIFNTITVEQLQLQLQDCELKLKELSVQTNFADNTFIVFPDWQQSEDLLYKDLKNLFTIIFNHPNKQNINLMIENSDISDEEANLIISGVILDILQEEDIDLIEDDINFSFVGNLNTEEWNVLLKKVQARIILNTENQLSIAKLEVDKLLSLELEQFASNFL